MKNIYPMKLYKRIFKEILKSVSEEVEVAPEELITSKNEDCFCARMAMCHCLSEHITDGEISRLTGMSQQVVSRNKILYPQRQRQSTTIRIITRIIKETIDTHITAYKQSTNITQTEGSHPTT
ncbi:MAG: hypothetical protein MJZ30_10000 [Paludibacteraceae bacterium]|nr:hypothetical protein [Paludibacteraceae bacterium]